MVHVGSSCFTVAGREVHPGAGVQEGTTVVWLHGEHDISTDGDLVRTLAGAMALNEGALVLDLSDVELISASTLGVIVTARKFLRQRSRSLTVRSPSAFVRRTILICHLDDLLGPSPEKPAAAAHLRSWVRVPTTERADRQPGPSAPAPDHSPRPVRISASAQSIKTLIRRSI
jgi:anti-anti-sigma factor